MKYRKILFLSMFFAVGTAEQCSPPKSCDIAKPDDCGASATCSLYSDANGWHHGCIPNYPTMEERQAAQAAGIVVESATLNIQIGPVGGSVTIKQGGAQ